MFSSRLGNFVKLVDQMLLAHLVQLARVSVTKFVYDSMAKGTETEREALFKAKLVFNEESKYYLTIFQCIIVKSLECAEAISK